MAVGYKLRCDICHEKGYQVFPFEFTLKELGLKGDYAHINCIIIKRREHERKMFKQGLPIPKRDTSDLYCH